MSNLSMRPAVINCSSAADMAAPRNFLSWVQCYSASAMGSLLLCLVTASPALSADSPGAPAKQVTERERALSGDAVASYPGELITSKGPLIDVTQNPGCGISGLSDQEQIERNRRLALYYFQASVEESSRDHKYTLASQGCVPKDGKSTWLYGSFMRPPSNPSIVKSGNEEEAKFIQDESRAWHTVFPDFGAVPGTLRVIPYKGGVYFSLLYAGTSKSGEHVEFWEVVNQLVDEDGRIYHYECWNDSAGMERAFQIAFGRSFLDMTLPEYFKMISDTLAKAGLERRTGIGVQPGT